METSTTYKSLAVGFAAGVLSTAAAGVGWWKVAIVLWVLSVGYIGYKKLDG